MSNPNNKPAAFSPSKVKAGSAPATMAKTGKGATAGMIPCPGANFVCDSGRWLLKGKDETKKNGSPFTHFACKGTGKFPSERVFTVTASERDFGKATTLESGKTLFAEWEAWAKGAGIAYRVSGA